MGFAFLWAASTAVAADEDCARRPTLLRQGQELADLNCAVECEAYYLTNPSAKPSPGEPPACQKNAVSYAYQMASPSACLKGAWDGVLSLPETLKAYGLLVENIGDYIHENIKEHRDFLARCDRDPACRREAARSLVQYSEKDRNGRWLVPDSVVDEEAQSTDIVSLLMKVRVHKASFQKYCETVLYGINSDLRSRNLESFDFAGERFNR
ncbi:MAG TPA: hypothetical protein PL182_07655, partial [Pseudobdellovibrionaceae bacterium]|nr:hypothetical protein [Pseudobdellovibrionaceae bacterium]